MDTLIIPNILNHICDYLEMFEMKIFLFCNSILYSSKNIKYISSQIKSRDVNILQKYVPNLDKRSNNFSHSTYHLSTVSTYNITINKLYSELYRIFSQNIYAYMSIYTYFSSEKNNTRMISREKYSMQTRRKIVSMVSDTYSVFQILQDVNLQLKIDNLLGRFIPPKYNSSRLMLKLQFGSKISMDRMYVFSIIDLDIYFVEKDIYEFLEDVIKIQSWYRKRRNLKPYFGKFIPLKYDQYCISNIRTQMYKNKKKYKITMISEIHTENIGVNGKDFYFSIKMRHVKECNYVLNNIHGGPIIHKYDIVDYINYNRKLNSEEIGTILFTHPYFEMKNNDYKSVVLYNLRSVK